MKLLLLLFNLLITPVEYSVVILGDTHYDAPQASVYHSDYVEPLEWLSDIQRAEFARNGEMWSGRCRRMLDRAVSLVSDDTKMVLQMGDLIQGDCGNAATHDKMLRDVMQYFKSAFGELPFVTVTGNHDTRGNYTVAGEYDRWGDGARKVYEEYMPSRMAEELGVDVPGTLFHFWIGPDVYIMLDFEKPQLEALERILNETSTARHTFVVSHAPILPYDGGDGKWFFLGADQDSTSRRHFRKLFAERNVICLCGHIHTTEYAEWYGDGGRISQMTMNSVWENDRKGQWVLDTDSPQDYGKSKGVDTELIAEYKSGLKTYIHSPSAGVYKLIVKEDGVRVDFYPGDSATPARSFEISAR